MNYIKNKNKKILLTIIFIFYLLSFYNNFFGIVPDYKWDTSTRHGSEYLVIGRLINAEKKGPFNDEIFVCDYNFQKGNGNNGYMKHYDYYFNEQHPDERKKTFYYSQLGGQAIFYSFLDSISPFNNYTNYQLFLFLNSLLLTILFILFYNWSYDIYGAFSTALTAIFIFFSAWVTYTANDIWWCLWMFYLPFIFFLYYFKNHLIINQKKIILFSCLLISLKTFINGFEFITTALITMTIGMFYYYFLRKEAIKQYIYTLLSFIIGSFFGIFFHAIGLLFALKQHFQTFGNSIDYITGRYDFRTGDLPIEASTNPILHQIKTYAMVIIKYLASNTFEIGFLPFTYENKFRYLFLLIIILISSYYLKKYKPSNINKTLIFTTFISIFAPLSWFIIFKQHSYIHLHVNFFLWYVPFLLFGYLIISVVIKNIIHKYIVK